MIDFDAVINEWVSIRPRLWGRGNPTKSLSSLPLMKFQSAPGFGAGGNWLRSHIASCPECVSIRPRLWGRGKHQVS